MAFNWQTFKTRTLTAILFVAIMLGGLLWNYESFFFLFSIIHFGCWYEYQKLEGLIDPAYQAISPIHKYSAMLAGWCIMFYCSVFTAPVASVGKHTISLLGFEVLIILVCLSELLFTPKGKRLKNIGRTILGLVYISLSLALLIDMRAPTEKPDLGWMLPLVLIASIWINDTMAYIVGSLIGRTPFSKISPKKTWEGTVGGAILAVVVAIFVVAPLSHLPVFTTAGIAAIAAVMGTIGDLLESKLKRMANVKDSGSIMPGHGGFLDRFDSLLVATPFVWAFLKFLA